MGISCQLGTVKYKADNQSTCRPSTNLPSPLHVLRMGSVSAGILSSADALLGRSLEAQSAEV